VNTATTPTFDFASATPEEIILYAEVLKAQAQIKANESERKATIKAFATAVLSGNADAIKAASERAQNLDKRAAGRAGYDRMVAIQATQAIAYTKANGQVMVKIMASKGNSANFPGTLIVRAGQGESGDTVKTLRRMLKVIRLAEARILEQFETAAKNPTPRRATDKPMSDAELQRAALEDDGDDASLALPPRNNTDSAAPQLSDD